MDVENVLFLRTDIERAGVVPLTSMYYFSRHERLRPDDWRPAVHDSDGLSAVTSRNERLWRPPGLSAGEPVRADDLGSP